MTADQHYINLYRTMMLQIRRSVVKGGVVVNAKPLFMLALIEDIRRGLPNQNMFAYDECLARIYYEKWKTFYPNMVPTPICKPFYHLANDGFWNIKWKSRVVEPPATDKKKKKLGNITKIKSYHISYQTRNRKHQIIWQLSILTSLH